MRGKGKTGFLFFLLLIWLLFGKESILAQAQEKEGDTFYEDTSGLSYDITGELVDEMSFEQVQQLLDEALGKESFSLEKAVKEMIEGKQVLSEEAVQEFLHGLFFSRIEGEKQTFFKILFLVLVAAIFSNFAEVFENGQIGDVCFYMIYLLLFTILISAYQELGNSLEKQLRWMTEFMKGLAPAYFTAVAAASGTISADVFYQGVLLLVWLVQWVLLTLLLPGANMYILLCLVNNLTREDMLSKMAELLETLINWGLKTMLGAVLGRRLSGDLWLLPWMRCEGQPLEKR